MLIANLSSFRGINANCCSSLSLPFSSFLFGLFLIFDFLGLCGEHVSCGRMECDVHYAAAGPIISLL